MAEIKKTATRRRKVQELQDGEVLNVEGVSTEEIKDSGNDTVVILSNFPRDIKYVWRDDNGNLREIVFKGNAGYLRGKESGILPVGGYGITTNVPAKAWEWLKSHRPKDPLIKNGLIFASTAKNARTEAKERTDLRHGFEPVDPNKGMSKQYNG